MKVVFEHQLLSSCRDVTYGKNLRKIFIKFLSLIFFFALELFRQVLLHIPACKSTNVCIAKIETVFAGSWLSGNAFVSGAGGLKFKSRAGQIGHSVANGSPPLYFFEKSCVAQAQWHEDEPRKLVTRFGVIASTMKGLNWFDNIALKIAAKTSYLAKTFKKGSKILSSVINGVADKPFNSTIFCHLMLLAYLGWIVKQI